GRSVQAEASHAGNGCKAYATAVRPLLERRAEQHHHYDAAEQREGREILMRPAVRLGDDLVADDEQHRAGGDAEDRRQRGLGDHDRRGADHAAEGLDETGEARDREPDAPRIADREQRYGDGQALRNVLQPDAEPERRAVRDIAAGETDADGHAFGKVVQRDRDHEQPKAAEPRSLRSLASLIEMLVRRVTMNHEERTRADEDADDDPRRSGADAKTLVAARVRERGLEQREEGRGEHHAGRTADQADEGSRRRLAQHEDRERADARAEPGEEARHGTEPENVGVSDRHMRASPLLSVRASAT